MSILKRITYDLKGQKRSLELSGVDLFVGPNGSGKTTALLAITAGLRGLAESPSDPVKPYIGPDREGSAELTFDAGVVFRDLSKTRGKDATRADLDAERIAGSAAARRSFRALRPRASFYSFAALRPCGPARFFRA